MSDGMSDAYSKDGGWHARAARKPNGHTIYVNGRAQQLPGEPGEIDRISYEEIVARAGMKGTPAIVYHKRTGGDGQRSGTLIPGKYAEGIAEMRFEVAHTGAA